MNPKPTNNFKTIILAFVLAAALHLALLIVINL